MRPIVLAALLLAGCAPHRTTGDVTLSEATRTIRTGPFQLRGASPQQRPHEFKPVRYPAVVIENQFLRCTALPTVGGRLYEVYNKASKSPLFFVNPYLDTHPDDFEGGHPWNLGGVEVNFPYFHHGNTYNDRWQWAPVRRPDGTAGVAMAFTSRPSLQRTVFRVLLRPHDARVHLEYRFENLNPYSWGLAAWIDTMHPKTMDTEFILPVPWVATHGYNRNRTDLMPWPVRDGVDLSWQRNVPPKTSLSEFGFMPRAPFHGCYEHKTDRGAVRIFDPATLPAMKLWTQAPPVTPDQYYTHFEIWTATSAVMEDPGHQAELSTHRAADCWFQPWGIGGYVFANANAALNLLRRPDGTLLAGICAARPVEGCVALLRAGQDTILRDPFHLDPAQPWRRELPARQGDVSLEVIGPDGASLASTDLRANEPPRERWDMPKKARWQHGANPATYDEIYSTLWRRRGHFLDGAIRRFKELLAKNPKSAGLKVDLARCYLKDEQVRVGYAYRTPGPEADADAARRRTDDLAQAVALLRSAIEAEPANANAHLYLGLALERQGHVAEAIASYRAALECKPPAPAAALYLARHRVQADAKGAVALARAAARAYPQSTRARQILIVALTAAGRAQQALEVARELVAIDPASALNARLLAEAARRAGDKVAARWEAESARLDSLPDARNEADADLRWLKGLPAPQATSP